MDPITAIAVANGAFTILEKVLPLIQQASAKGQITPEQQAALKAKVDALRGDAFWTGPEWETDSPGS